PLRPVWFPGLEAQHMVVEGGEHFGAGKHAGVVAASGDLHQADGFQPDPVGTLFECTQVGLAVASKEAIVVGHGNSRKNRYGWAGAPQAGITKLLTWQSTGALSICYCLRFRFYCRSPAPRALAPLAGQALLRAHGGDAKRIGRLSHLF